jgi:hypothetical protein
METQRGDMNHDILTPKSGRDWLALILTTALGIAALAWLLPLSARHPFVVPPDIYDRFTPVKKPFADLANMTPVAVGITVVTVCALLYCAWVSWSLSHPVSQRRSRVKREDR